MSRNAASRLPTGPCPRPRGRRRAAARRRHRSGRRTQACGAATRRSLDAKRSCSAAPGRSRRRPSDEAALQKLGPGLLEDVLVVREPRELRAQHRQHRFAVREVLLLDGGLVGQPLCSRSSHACVRRCGRTSNVVLECQVPPSQSRATTLLPLRNRDEPSRARAAKFPASSLAKRLEAGGGKHDLRRRRPPPSIRSHPKARGLSATPTTHSAGCARRSTAASIWTPSGSSTSPAKAA